MSQSGHSKIHEGGCLCGAIRYRVAGPIVSVAHCHCGMCRKSSGGTLVTWVFVSRDDFSITEGTPAVYRSSDHAERRFCPTCGSQLTFASDRTPTRIDITLGSLDHPERYPADRHIWTSAQISWLHADDGLPAFPEGTPKGYKPARRER